MFTISFRKYQKDNNGLIGCSYWGVISLFSVQSWRPQLVLVMPWDQNKKTPFRMQIVSAIVLTCVLCINIVHNLPIVSSKSTHQERSKYTPHSKSAMTRPWPRHSNSTAIRSPRETLDTTCSLDSVWVFCIVKEHLKWPHGYWSTLLHWRDILHLGNLHLSLNLRVWFYC